MALVAAVILAAAGIGLGLYRDHNLHHDERMTRRALSAGYVERHAAVGGVTVNYAEGPSDGLALLLILPQTPMRTRCASRPRYRTARRSWSSQGTTSTRRRPTISRGPSTRRAGRRRHGTLFREREPACVITDRVATPQQDPCTRGSRLSLLVTRACRHFVRFVSSCGWVVALLPRQRGRHRRGDNAGVYTDRPKWLLGAVLGYLCTLLRRESRYESRRELRQVARAPQPLWRVGSASSLTSLAWSERQTLSEWRRC